MAKGPVLGDRYAYGQAWSKLPLGDRRRITRAVNKGAALEDGDEAQLAVMTARRQMGFWRWAWAIGPAITFLQFGTELTVWVVSLVMSTFATGAVAWIFFRRARRAEAANLELAQKAAKRGRRGEPHPDSKEGRELARLRAEQNRTAWDRIRERLPF